MSCNELILLYSIGQIQGHRGKQFIRKWRLKCKAVAESLEEAGDKLFTFTRFPGKPMEIDPHVKCDRAIA